MLNWKAQNTFLRTVEIMVPEVLVSLQADVYPVYIATLQQVTGPNEMVWENIQYASEDYCPHLALLKKRLFKWGKTFNLLKTVDYWVLNIALDTLRWWNDYPQIIDKEASENTTLWKYPSTAYYLPDITAPVSSGLDKQNIEEFLKQYKKYIEKQHELAGWPKEKKISDEYFIWFVHYQVQGMTQQQIADKCFRTREAVKEALKNISAEIGIPLRGKRGRPRKA